MTYNALRQEQLSVLKDINNSLLSHLFEHGALHGDELKSICVEARRDLLLSLRENLSPYRQDSTKRDPEKEEALRTLIMWLDQKSLFIDENSTDEHIETYDTVRSLLKQAQEGKTEWEDFELRTIFCNLVNFALLKVDALYGQMYYMELYQRLQRPEVLKAIRRDVRVPFYQGNVGLAVQIGGFSQSNSFSEPQGYVASNDLKQGSACTLYVGVGRQAVDVTSPQELGNPKPRWQFDSERCDEMPPQPWTDQLDFGRECCSAVVFCSFPLLNVFPRSDFPVGVVENGSASSRPAWSAGDNNPIYRLLDHICRNYEHSLLRELDYYEEAIVSELTVSALGRSFAKGDPTLDVLASSNIRSNPTGGLLAIRYGETRHGLRICVPQLEYKLEDKLDDDPQIKARLESNEEVAGNDPLMQLLNRNLYVVEFGKGADFDPTQSHKPYKMLLHGADKLDETLVGKLQALLHKQPCILNDFFTLVRLRYFNVLSDWYRGRPSESLSFQKARVARDACENIARTIAQIICQGLPVDNQYLIENTLLMMKLACSYLSDDDDDPRQTEIQDRLKQLDQKMLETDLKALDHESRELRRHLLGVSAFYWAATILEPEEQALRFLTPNIDWYKCGRAAKHRLLRPHILALMNSKNNKGPVRLLRTHCNGRLDDGRDDGTLADEGGDRRLDLNKIPAFDLTFLGYREGEDVLEFQARNVAIDERKTYLCRCRPKYRVAGLLLNQEALEKTIGDSIVRWNREAMQQHALIISLIDHLDAAEVDFAAAIEILEPRNRWHFEREAPKTFPDNWNISLYTAHGCWTRHSIQVAASKKEYEDYIKTSKEAQWKKLFTGVTHNIGNSLAPFGLVADSLENDLAKQLIKGAVDSLSTWTQLILGFINRSRFIEREELNYSGNLSDTVKQAVAAALLQYSQTLRHKTDDDRPIRAWEIDQARLYTTLSAIDQTTDRYLQRCQELLSDKLVFEFPDLPNTIEHAPIFHGILLEAMLNALKNTQKTEAAAYVKVRVSVENGDRIIEIVNSASYSDALNYLQPQVRQAGRGGGIGVDFLDQLTSWLDIGLSKREIGTPKPWIRHVLTRFTISHDWKIKPEDDL